MAQTPSGQKPERPNRRTNDAVEFGSPNDSRRLLWAISINLYERSNEGADWNDILDAAENRGINRSWAHEEIKRRLRWGDAHLFKGNLHAHYTKRHHPDLLYDADQPEHENAGFPQVNTLLSEKAAAKWSLWRILVQNSGRFGVHLDDLLDKAEEHGMDRMWAHEILALWLDRGDIEKGGGDSRLVPQKEEWRS